MDQLLNIFDGYVRTRNTDYAILISGDWGSGKTYLWKNVLAERVRKTPAPGKPGRRYAPIYLSLYGIERIEDIGSELLFESIYPLLLKKGMPAAHPGLKLVGQASWGREKLDLYKDLDPRVIMEHLDFSGCVICFDDLERCRQPVQHVLGFINNFVEHSGVKVVIIANEHEIAGPDADRLPYYKIKEKMIGLTLEVQPDFPAVVATIIKNYTGERRLQSFLRTHQDQILKMLQLGQTKNIRILKHSLNFFGDAFGRLSAIKVPAFDAKALDILQFILACTFDIRMGQADLVQLRAVSSTRDFMIRLNLSGQPGASNYLRDFYHKYYTDSSKPFDFYPSLVKYILSGYFDQARFRQEIESQLDQSRDGKHRILDTMLGNYWSLTDQQFAQATAEALRQAAAGQFELKYYPMLLSRFLFFSRNHMISEPADQLLQLFTPGMRAAAANADYVEETPLEQLNPTMDDEIFRTFSDLFNQTNETLKNKHYQTVVGTLFDLLEKDFDRFCLLFASSPGDAAVRYQDIPVLSHYSVDLLFRKLTRLGNPQLVMFKNALELRYQNGRLQEDFAPLVELKKAIDQHLSSRADNTTLSGHLFRSIQDTIDQACRILKPREMNP